MPLLSLTMEYGTVLAWNVEMGLSFAAGVLICLVETDEATVIFKA
jgi:pyruvate/2-oxoglutarate dehydrogenase complex dihydrolipoamide acyltransferase (E2) component